MRCEQRDPLDVAQSLLLTPTQDPDSVRKRIIRCSYRQQVNKSAPHTVDAEENRLCPCSVGEHFTPLTRLRSSYSATTGVMGTDAGTYLPPSSPIHYPNHQIRPHKTLSHSTSTVTCEIFHIIVD
ncbi:hypothetical protein AcV7_007179 [Taiwanofungus camphoratus]|nr:hypothetical protein AcV7_007179 [Antrodia cinnamomea]